MLAFSPPPLAWPHEDSMALSRHQPINFYGDRQRQCAVDSCAVDSSLLHSPSLSLQPRVDFSDTVRFVGDAVMVKKLSHNASERDRRKRINSLYASLRSLLPSADKTRKLSMPATVSRVVKFIPELEKEVEILVRRKEELLSIISRERVKIDHHQLQQQQGGETIDNHERQEEVLIRNSAAVSLNSLGDREVVLQMSAAKDKKVPISDVSRNLEEDGLDLLNASSFETFGEMVFYSFHLKAQDYAKVEIEMLRERLMPFLKMISN